MTPTIDAQFFGGPLDGEDRRVTDPPPPKIWPSRTAHMSEVYVLERVMRMADGRTRLAIYRWNA